MTPFRIMIHGRPAPAGSKTSQVVRDRKGQVVWYKTSGGAERPVLVTRPASKYQKPWQYAVQIQLRAAWYGEPLHGPLAVTMEFIFRRPASHYGTGKHRSQMKPSAPKAMTSTPDLSKLIRATEDGCTGIAWQDDRQIVATLAGKQWSRDESGCIITIARLPKGTVRLDAELTQIRSI